MVVGRAHSQMFGAQSAQQWGGDPQRCADFCHAHMPNRVGSEQMLEADHDVLVPAGHRGTVVRRTSRQAFDNGVDQLLLQPVRCFSVGKNFRSNRTHAGGGGMEAAQTSARRSRRPPALCDRQDAERASGQRATVFNQFLDRHPDRTPSADAVGSRM